ncbi:MAG: leucyl/phenylalanyl-tRNA--protein transferase [Geminicoccaceae bacterium]
MPLLTPDLLLYAYASGLFPMADDREDPSIHWVDPERRGMIPLDRFHVPRRLARIIRQQRFEIRTDTAFSDVILACAESRPNRPRTWLNDELIGLYCDLHELHYAHSIECWRDDKLVGGAYGVSLGGAFFGESMFSLERDASKVALAALVDRLNQGGYRLLDTQFLTDHLSQFGAVEISRDAYQRRLKEALGVQAVFYSDGGAIVSSTPWTFSSEANGSSQSTTHIS